MTWRILNKNRKYFNPLVSDPGTEDSNYEKKTEGRKSRWTVPLSMKAILRAPNDSMYTV